jgi:hypothetical protein
MGAMAATNEPTGAEARVFYRIVTADPPTLADFTSNEERGVPPRRRDPEALRLWSGISVFEAEQQTRLQAMLFPRLGQYIAALRVGEGGAIRIERTTRTEGHFTLWGEPADLLACVLSVVAI